LKSRTAFAIIASTVILASVVATSPVVYAASYSFELTATGQAYDYRNHVYRDVVISLSGTGYGSLTWYTWLRVASGTATVDGYGTFRITGGWSMLIQRYHYVYLYIRITPLYGGPITGWYIRGTTRVYYANEIPSTLSSRYIILPTSPYTILYNLRLTGEITLS